ncbi:MAG: hypothetical protein Ct9H300mP1_05990 [Planctomycetaceae bacterium]|nr:MAG: hypothetical protein Ct9H300mP1_05990 [Planctomycetaceae bacterium]
MGRTADVVIVGGGVTGLCTALALKERGWTGSRCGKALHGIGTVGAGGWRDSRLRGARGGRRDTTGRSGVLRHVRGKFGVPVEVHRTGYLLVARSHERATWGPRCRWPKAGCRLGLVRPRKLLRFNPAWTPTPPGARL